MLRGRAVTLVSLLLCLHVARSCQNSTCANSFARLKQHITQSIACEAELGWRLGADSLQPATLLKQIQHAYPNMTSDELPTGYCHEARRRSLIKHVGIPVDGTTVCATFEWTACLCGTSTGCPSGNCSLFVPAYSAEGHFSEIAMQHASVDFKFRGFVHSPLKSTQQVLAYEKQATTEYAKYMNFRFGLQQKIQSCNSSEIAAASTTPVVSGPQCRLPYWRMCAWRSTKTERRRRRKKKSWGDWGTERIAKYEPIGKWNGTAFQCEPCDPHDPDSCKPGGMVTTWTEPEKITTLQGKKEPTICHIKHSGPCEIKWTRATIRGSEYWPPSPNRCSSDSPLVQAWFGYAGSALMTKVFSDADVGGILSRTRPQLLGRLSLIPASAKLLHPSLKHTGEAEEGCPRECQRNGEHCEVTPGLCAGAAGQLVTAVMNAVENESPGTRLCVQQALVTGRLSFRVIAGSTYTGSCKGDSSKGEFEHDSSAQPAGTCSALFRVWISRAVLMGSPKSITTPGNGNLTEPFVATSVVDYTYKFIKSNGKSKKSKQVKDWRMQANDRDTCLVIEQALRKGVKEFRDTAANQGELELGERREYQRRKAAYQCTAHSSNVGFAQQLCNVPTAESDELAHHSGSDDWTRAGGEEEAVLLTQEKVTEDIAKVKAGFTQMSVMSADEAFAWL